MAHRLLFSYRATGKPVAVISIDTATGQTQRFDTAALISEKTAVPYGGKLYFGVGGTLAVFDPMDGGVMTLGAVADTLLYSGCVAPDGMLFFGSYPQGRVLSYDPINGTLTDYGRMDDEGPAQYAYSIQADADYVYVGLGQAPWYLGILSRLTSEKTLYFKDENSSARFVERSVNGLLWYKSYRLDSGVPIPVESKPPMIPPYEQSGANIDATTWPTRIGYEANLDDAVPFTNKPAVIRWRATGGEWNTHAPDDLPMSPQVIHRVYPYDDTRLLCLSGVYGPVYLYTPATKAVEILGPPQRSLYDATQIGGKWYLSGYPAATYEYDPAQPWTLTASSADHTQTNPRAVMAVDKYHYFSAKGSDGRLYVAAAHARDSVGGELGWYTPNGGASGGLREPLARWEPRGLAAVGDKIVYSGLSLDGLDGTLFVVDVFDPATVEREIVPLPDLSYTSAGCILRAGDTDIIGLAGGAAYRWNVVTGAQVWRVTLPGSAMDSAGSVNRRAEIAPDGLVYFYIGAAIFAIDPATGALSRVVADGGEQGIVTWHGGTAYMYGTTELRRIKFT